MEKGLLKIGEIAQVSGDNQTTVRYYTEVGLLQVVDHTQGGYRLYDREDTVERLKTIQQVNETRVSLAQIKEQIA